MDPSGGTPLWLGILSLAVGAGGLGVATWGQVHNVGRDRVRIRVELAEIKPNGYVFRFHNDSAFPVRLRELGVYARDIAGDRKRFGWPAGRSQEEVAPRSALKWEADYMVFASQGVDLRHGIQAYAWLSGPGSRQIAYSDVVKPPASAVVPTPQAVARPKDVGALHIGPPQTPWWTWPFRPRRRL